MNRRGVFAVLSPIAMATLAAGQTPPLTWIGTLPGGTTSTARGISLDGQWIVGGSGSSNVPSNQHEAFRWSAATGMESLGPWGSGSTFRSSAAVASFDGQVVAGEIPSDHVFRWTPVQGKESVFYGWNVDVTGISIDGGRIAGSQMWQGATTSGFHWSSREGLVFLEQGAWSGARVRGMSADGRFIIGIGNIDVQHPWYPVVWRVGIGAGEVLSFPPGTRSGTSAISADGRIIAGFAFERSSPLLWIDRGPFTELPLPPGTTRCGVRALSGNGRIAVGTCEPGPVASIWLFDGAVYQPWVLTEYLLARGYQMMPGASLTVATSISGDGTVIAGDGIVPGFEVSAFRLELCYANCDGSTAAPFLNVDDFACFMNRFVTASVLPPDQQVYTWANCDKSTVQPVLNIDDFVCFINRLVQGCVAP
jgi:uncharacterized membrane protein